MFAYIIRRILATIPVMAVVALFVFSLLHLSPGDPAVIIAGDTASLDGLDEPLYVQFVTWVWGLLHGDLGISIFTNLPVSKLIAQRVEPTVTLTISTLIVAVLAAIRYLRTGRGRDLALFGIALSQVALPAMSALATMRSLSGCAPSRRVERRLPPSHSRSRRRRFSRPA